MFSSTPITFNDYTLRASRIDVWRYSLNQVFTQGYELLSREEQQRADRFYFSHHRRRFIVAHSVLRLILAQYANTSAQDLQFSSNKYGKPDLENSHQLQFNLSHSGDWALLAVGKQYPIGIDLEQFSHRSYEGIAEQLFSDEECRALKRINSFLRPLVFFNIWAQKEAFIKACGLGLSYPTKDFNVPILPQEVAAVTDHLHQRVWHMRTFMPIVACYAALCHDPQIDSVRYFSFNNEHLHRFLSTLK